MDTATIRRVWLALAALVASAALVLVGGAAPASAHVPGPNYPHYDTKHFHFPCIDTVDYLRTQDVAGPGHYDHYDVWSDCGAAWPSVYHAVKWHASGY